MLRLRCFAPLLLACLIVFVHPGCGRKPARPAATPPPEALESTPAPAEQPPSTPAPVAARPAIPTPKPQPRTPQAPALAVPPPPAELWTSLSGARALAEAKAQLTFGPRPSGSPAAEQTRSFLTQRLLAFGWKVERQQFQAQTPRGELTFVNLVARYGVGVAGSTQTAIIGTHYDTKAYSTIVHLGACDGAAGPGTLLELARTAALDPAFAAKLELVFFDGEEALTQPTAADGLYGSRHYVTALQESGRGRQFRVALLWDCLGDHTFSITLPPDTAPDLAQGVFTAAEALGCRKHFVFHDRAVTGDHLPFVQANLPAVLLANRTYVAWHTADDTAEQLSPDALQQAAAVTLRFLKQTLP